MIRDTDMTPMQFESTQKFGDSALPILRRNTSVALIIAYPVLHLVAVWLGLYFSSASQTATLWISNALLLAMMIILDRRWWAPLMIGLVAAEAFSIVFVTAHLSLKTAVFFSAANMSEAIIAALMWQGLVAGRINMSRLRDCVLLVFVVATSAPALGGLVASIGQVGFGDALEFFSFWQLWWAANALGIMVVSTAILAWVGISSSSLQILKSRRLEAAVLVLSVVALTIWIFASSPGSEITVLGLPSMLYPLLIWGAVRFGTAVSVSLVLLIAIIAIIGTDGGSGPYAVPSYTVYQSVLSLQVFLVAAAIMALILGAAFSERRVAFRVLRESEDKFSKAFHASPDAICICSVSSGRVIDVNQGFCDITGFARERVIGVTLEQLKLQPLDEQRRQIVEQVDAQLPNKQIKVHLPVENGTTKECEVTFETTEIEGQRSMISVVHDLTIIRAEEEKRRTLELQLMQSKKMEAIGQLTGGIAHDFNNLLAGILGNTELAESRVSELKDGTLAEYLEGIREGGMRARDLISQLLTFGRNKTSDAKPIRLYAVLDDVMRLLRQVLPSSLRVDTAVRAEDAMVLADPVQLQQVILNLCINARDATGSSGTIEIAIDVHPDLNGSCSSCQESFDGDYVCLSVSDSGPGIEANDLTRIFEPFYTSKEMGKGSGLGLAVVHGAVHSHNGHIIVDSAPGKTTVSTYFPLYQGADVDKVSQSAGATRPDKTEPLKGKVLLVDDEVLVRNVMVQTLESHGLDVTPADSGTDALDVFRAEPGGFDLVITDQTMPNMTGVTLATKLLAIRPDLPVILCSGFNGDIDEKRAGEMGIRGFYQKPVDFAELRRQVADLLSS
jgi:PAS domain S-box-containing protein